MAICDLNVFRGGFNGSRNTLGIGLLLHGPKTMLFTDFIFQNLNGVIKTLISS